MGCGTTTLRFAEADGFPETSPFLSGHFPGNPIVPGSIILSYLSAGLADRGLTLTRIVRIKFRRPLPPSVPIEVTVKARDGLADIEIADRVGPLVTGRIAVSG